TGESIRKLECACDAGTAFDGTYLYHGKHSKQGFLFLKLPDRVCRANFCPLGTQIWPRAQ
ncbi:MAG: hypothetical protein WKG03_06645, partial [Telluria sp.]